MKEDWIEVELGEVCQVKMGQSPPSSTYNTDKKGLPFFQGKAEFTELHPIVEKWCTEPTKIAEINDILLSVRAPVGATNVANQKCAIGRGLAAIAYKYDYKYILAYLRLIEKKLDSQGTGTTFRAISGSVLKFQMIPLAPLPIQRAIVLKIESLFALLDKGIADLKTAQEQLKVYRQAVLKKAFEGEFTKEWRENNKWSIFTFDEITESLKRGPFGGDLKKEFFVEKGYAVYEQKHAINNDFTNIRYFINEERYDLLKACNANPGDYIVSCSGTMGKIARIPEYAPKGVINQALLRIRINEKKITHKYFIEFFRSQIFQKLILQDSRGTGMQNMAGIKEIKPIKINLPSIEEQHIIVREIESRLSVCDKVEQNIAEALEKAEALRQSILKKAFEGKLLTKAEIAKCKQEADYQPASELLKKIKAEKK